MTTTKINVTAEAWTSVSRSGHWTFFSSAQHETKKAMIGLRRFSAFSVCCLAIARSRSRLRCSFSFCFAALRSAREGFEVSRSVDASSARPTSARDGAGAFLDGLGGSDGVRLHSRDRGAGLGVGVGVASRRAYVLAVILGVCSRLERCLELGHVARDRVLRVVLRPRLRGPFGRAGLALLLSLLAPPLLSLLLCPGLRHRYREPLTGLLVSRVAAAPAAVLADLDSVRRVPPRLVRLIVAALALLAREGDADSYV